MDLKSYLSEASRLFGQLADHVDEHSIEAAINSIATALIRRRTVMICGNGGSAADAMHITGELVGRFLKERQALKVVCLSSNPVVLTAWANDYSYETVFSRQVEAFAEPGGVLVGLSTSGNSANVVNAFATARKLDVTTVAFTGQGGGKLASLADILLAVPSRSTPLIQQAHVCLYHYLCEQIEARCAASDKL